MRTPVSDTALRAPRFLALFRRVTTSGGFIPEIDGLRFIAISSVLLFHVAVGLAIKSPVQYARPAQGIFAAIAWNGFRGVELFFVISGFILGLPFASHALLGKQQVDLKQYFLRRLTRLEPPYLLCMLLLFALHVFVRGRSAHELFPHLAASLVYLHDLIYAAESPINNVTWSLEVEVQFYLLAPLLAALFFIRDKAARRATFVALCAGLAALSWFFILPGGRAYLSILRFAHFFLIGFLLADVYLVDWKGKPSKSFLWDVLSVVGWPLLFLLWNAGAQPGPGQVPGREPALTTLLVPAAVFFLYNAAFRGRLSNRAIVNPWVTTLGGMCYTIYLFHNPALAMILGRTGDFAPSGFYPVDLLAQLAIATPLVLLPSAVYFVLVEKPCMRRDWPQRLLQRIQSMRAEITPR